MMVYKTLVIKQRVKLKDDLQNTSYKTTSEIKGCANLFLSTVGANNLSDFFINVEGDTILKFLKEINIYTKI